MHTTAQILAAISEKYGGATDYRISKLLGTGTGTVGNWRVGRSAMSNDYAVKAAALLGWESAYVIACMEHERAEKLEATDEIRATWSKIAERFKPAAAVILAVALFALAPIGSSSLASARDAVCTDGLYIMRSGWRRMVRRIAQFLRCSVSRGQLATGGP